MFGIAWGVGSLLLLVGLGEGFRSGQQRTGQSSVRTSCSSLAGGYRRSRAACSPMRQYSFTYSDYLAIKNEANLVKHVSPVLNREDIRAVSDFSSANGQVFGVAADYNQIRTIPIRHRALDLNDADDNRRRRVAVLGRTDQEFLQRTRRRWAPRSC